MPNASTLFRNDGLMIIDLRGHEGNFETSTDGQLVNRRSFGLWSMSMPRKGDLVIRPVGKDNTLWVIESVERSFAGSEGDDYYKGVMVDVVGHYQRTGTHLISEKSALAANIAVSRFTN